MKGRGIVLALSCWLPVILLGSTKPVLVDPPTDCRTWASPYKDGSDGDMLVGQSTGLARGTVLPQFVQKARRAEDPVRSKAAASPRGVTGNCRLLWSRHHANADYLSASISRTTGKVIAGTAGQPTQVEMMSLDGCGDAHWEYAGTGTGFVVAAAHEADVFAALDYNDAAHTVVVRKWHAASPTPDWSYTITSAALFWPQWSLVVSADGSTICALVEDPSDPNNPFAKLYCFDAASGPPPVCTHTASPGFEPIRLAVSRYGDYVGYTAININTAFGRIFMFTRDSCNNYWTGIVLTGFAGLNISPDGNWLAHDSLTLVPLGNEFVLRKWYNILGYLGECSYAPSGFLATTLACSWSFNRVLVGWTNSDGNQGKVQLFNMPSCTPACTYNYAPGEDVPWDGALTVDGGYAVVGNLTSAGANPDVLVFNTACSQPVCTFDAPDSVVDVDIAAAPYGGAYVAVCGDYDRTLYLVRVYEGIVTVCPSGANPYTTIQSGINAAGDGYLVELCDGVYTGTGNTNVSFANKAISLQSQNGDPVECVMDGFGAARGFTMASSQTKPVWIRNVWICDCEPANPADNGGAVYCDDLPDMAPVTIAGSLITGNHAARGAGIYANLSKVALHRSTITGNRADIEGAGIWQYGGAASADNCILWGNGSPAEDPDNWICHQAGWVHRCCCDFGEYRSRDIPCSDDTCPAGHGSFDADPLFCAPIPWEMAPTPGGDYHISPASPCASTQQPACGLIGALDVLLYPTCTGDLNCDGTISFDDINPFVLYLSNPPVWQATFPCCDPVNGDINCNGSYYDPPDFGDINPFVALMVQCNEGCPCPGPITCPP